MSRRHDGRLAGLSALVADVAAGPAPLRSPAAVNDAGPIHPLPMVFYAALRAQLAAGAKPSRLAREFDLNGASLRYYGQGVRRTCRPRTPAAPGARAA